MSVSLTSFDQFIENVGTKSIQVIFMISVLLTIIVGALVAGGTEESYIHGFVSGLSNVLNIRWIYDGMRDLSVGAKYISDSITSVDIISMFNGLRMSVFGVIKVVINMISIVLTGYITVSIFVMDTLPGLVKPVGTFISIGLMFVQFCCLWTITKYLYNIVRSLISSISGTVPF
ncbi:MAG: hypothetical protein QXT64_01815 [Desulfurococcaceae archaeon]